MTAEEAMQALRGQRGTMARIAKGICISRGAVAMWDKVPAERVPAIERATGIPRHELRPDLWPAEAAA